MHANNRATINSAGSGDWTQARLITVSGSARTVPMSHRDKLRHLGEALLPFDCSKIPHCIKNKAWDPASSTICPDLRFVPKNCSIVIWVFIRTFSSFDIVSLAAKCKMRACWNLIGYNQVPILLSTFSPNICRFHNSLIETLGTKSNKVISKHLNQP